MSDYIVSARKYRPDSFETLIGQDNIAQTLKNSIARGQLAHAYLFCGPRGVGKTTTARIFAKMINCSSPLENGDPCGKCESCVSFAEGRSYCIYEMDAASNNSVDDIKELIDKVRIAPQVGRYSVYIIDEVHMLSQQAFNAFLKTLEEPPEYAIFILATTEKHKILPTILSRCQTYDFNRISVDNIVKNLRDIASKEGVTADDESLHVIALKADGAMRDALTIFDQAVAFCGNEIKYQDVIRNLNVLDYEYTFSLVDNFLAGDYATALRTFDEILAKGFNALHFASTLSSHLRDLLVAKAGGVDSLLELAPSLKERYRAQAAKCSEKFLYDALTQTSACEAGYKMSVNPRLHIEFCLMKLCFLNRTPAAAATPTAATPAASAAPALQTPAPAATAAPATPAPTAQTSVAPAPSATQAAATTPTPAPAAASAAPTPAPVPTAESAPAPTATPAPEPTPVPAAPAPATEPAAVPATPTPVAAPATESAAVPTATPAPEPAVMPAAATPAPAPAAKKASFSGLSIKSIKEGDMSATPASDGDSANDPVPSDEAIKEAWHKLCEISSANARLYNGLTTARLTITEEDGKKVVRYAVINDSLKKWFNEKNPRIQQKLRELALSSKLDLIVDLIPEDPSEKVVVTPEEKAREMMQQNPQVQELVNDLGLEIK